jgi:L-alanine-DL-glutamate epimerase-like enolase superfamily enzyme
MKQPTIADVRAVPISFPVPPNQSVRLGIGRSVKRDAVLVRVESSDGHVGWGEAHHGRCPGAIAKLVDTTLRELVLGMDAFDVNGVWARVYRMQLASHGMGAAAALALSGLDIALWDLRGKLERRPLFELLGGAVRSRVPAYASLLQYYGSSARVAQHVRRAVDAGYGAIKLHERSVDAVAAAREVLGAGIPLMVDTNCGWTPAEVVDAIRPMAAFDPAWIEEPVWPPEDTEALMAVKRSTGLPMAAGENAASVHELESLVLTGAADYVQPSVIKSGGVTMLQRLSQLCQNSNSVAFSPQTAFFGPGFLATLHVLAAHRDDVRVERLYCELAHTPYAHAVRMKDGGFDVPDRPGLGAEPDAALLGSNATP